MCCYIQLSNFVIDLKDWGYVTTFSFKFDVTFDCTMLLHSVIKHFHLRKVLGLSCHLQFQARLSHFFSVLVNLIVMCCSNQSSNLFIDLKYLGYVTTFSFKFDVTFDCTMLMHSVIKLFHLRKVLGLSCHLQFQARLSHFFSVLVNLIVMCCSIQSSNLFIDLKYLGYVATFSFKLCCHILKSSLLVHSVLIFLYI